MHYMHHKRLKVIYITYKINFRKNGGKETLWTEKNLAKLVANIITRAAVEQQTNLFSIIIGNFESSKQQIVGLKKEINKIQQMYQLVYHYIYIIIFFLAEIFSFN